MAIALPESLMDRQSMLNISDMYVTLYGFLVQSGIPLAGVHGCYAVLNQLIYIYICIYIYIYNNRGVCMCTCEHMYQIIQLSLLSWFL